MHEVEASIFRMYADIQLGQGEICRKCLAGERSSGRQLGRPLTYWHIGDRFGEDRHRILFVGKNAVDGSDLPVVEGGFHDASKRGGELFLGQFSGFWNYTGEILSRFFNCPREEAIRRVAITNLVKCNHSTGDVRKDSTSESMKRNCIDDLGVVWRELDILKPRSVIFYTHLGYDDQIARFRCGNRFADATGRTHTIPIGSKKMLWWHRRFFNQEAVVLDCLRTSHPERMKKDEYVDAIVSWLAARQI